MRAKTTMSTATGGLILALVGSAACVVTPYNHEYTSPFDPISFEGFAQEPGAELQVQAFNKLSETWLTIATATASTTPTTITGESLYGWQTSVRFEDLPDWECFWGHDSPSIPSLACSIPPGSANARVRVWEDSGHYLVTFDEDGIDCVMDKMVTEGHTWMQAGWECRSGDSPVISLFWLT